MIWLPLLTRGPSAGTESDHQALGDAGCPAAAVLVAGVNPAPRSSAWAAATEMPVTLGTFVYRPVDQPPAEQREHQHHGERGGEVGEPAAEQQPLQPGLGRAVPGSRGGP